MSSTASWKAFAATVFVYQDSRARTTGDGPAAIPLAGHRPTRGHRHMVEPRHPAVAVTGTRRARVSHLARLDLSPAA
ncbi:hypothetical protein [Streptomyces sp. NPDC001034]|uniref:hypothetical protein n=1 Tax=Streptomyces sp. NPDC001034 TaxID=3154375 RepID=UPI003326FF49